VRIDRERAPPSRHVPQVAPLGGSPVRTHTAETAAGERKVNGGRRAGRRVAAVTGGGSGGGGGVAAPRACQRQSQRRSRDAAATQAGPVPEAETGWSGGGGGSGTRGRTDSDGAEQRPPGRPLLCQSAPSAQRGQVHREAWRRGDARRRWRARERPARGARESDDSKSAMVSLAGDGSGLLSDLGLGHLEVLRTMGAAVRRKLSQ